MSERITISRADRTNVNHNKAGVTTEESDKMADKDAEKQRRAEQRERTAEVLSNIDELLEEVDIDWIDERLDEAMGETTAVDFINSYVQRGGQAAVYQPTITTNDWLYTTLWGNGILLLLWINRRYGSPLRAALVIGFRKMVKFGQRSVLGVRGQKVKA